MSLPPFNDLQIGFELPAGSYATVLVDALLGA